MRSLQLSTLASERYGRIVCKVRAIGDGKDMELAEDLAGGCVVQGNRKKTKQDCEGFRAWIAGGKCTLHLGNKSHR